MTKSKFRSRYRETVSEFPMGIHLGPAHFPVGTKFKVNASSIDRRHDGVIFEVKDVIRNGPRSYVVETTQFAGHPFGPTMRQSFNLQWVSEILTRGQGPTVEPQRSRVNLMTEQPLDDYPLQRKFLADRGPTGCTSFFPRRRHRGLCSMGSGLPRSVVHRA